MNIGDSDEDVRPRRQQDLQVIIIDDDSEDLDYVEGDSEEEGAMDTEDDEEVDTEDDEEDEAVETDGAADEARVIYDLMRSTCI